MFGNKSVQLTVVVVFLLLVMSCSNSINGISQINNADINWFTESDKYYIVGGDMYFEKTNSFNDLFLNSNRAITQPFVKKWDKGKVFYFYKRSDYFTDSEKESIEIAMTEISNNSGVEFICGGDLERVAVTHLFLEIMKSDDPNIGGSATVGCVNYPIYWYRSNQKGVITHELLHVLGFSHEHQRSDRDQYISIQWDNIMSEYKYNFDKIPKYVQVGLSLKFYSTLYGSYDYNSIMHYGSYAFSNNGLITIKSNGQNIGQRYTMSDIDILALQAVYGQ